MRWFLLLPLVAVATLTARADAPQFRGPGGRGTSNERNLPVAFDAKAGLRWKAALPGRGLSNPVVADGRIYVTACSGFGQTREHVLCFDLKTGKQLWERRLWATGGTLCHPKTNMAAPTPVTDGAAVYALFATGDVVCYEKDGTLRWYRSLVVDYPTVGNNVGMAASPVLVGDLLVVCLENVGESFAVALDAKTGKNRWRVERPRGINWVTPLVIRNAGKIEVLFQDDQALTAHDVATGKVTWTFRRKGLSTIPSPTEGDGVLFVPGDGLVALRPGTAKEAPKVLWKSAKLRMGYCSPLHHRGRVYAVSTGGIVNCADAATGKTVWSHRLDGGATAASPLAADGKLYCVTENGTITVLVDEGAEPRVLTTSALRDTILASPIAAGGSLLLRSDHSLYCFGSR